MRVWLDDERAMPADFDIHVHNKAEVAAMLAEHDEVITLMSFDNDLGIDEPEGWEIMQWLAYEYAERYPQETRVHSANGPASERMRAFDANFRKHVLGEMPD